MRIYKKEALIAYRKEFLDKISIFITTAFALVAGLAWNDAIKSLFVEGGSLYFLAQYSIWLYAISVTLLAVLATIWIVKISAKINK